MANVCDGNGGPKTKLEVERRDLFKVAGFILALVVPVVAGGVGLSMYIFQTRAEALVEHAVIEQAAALHAQEAKLRREFRDNATTDTKKILRTLDINQRKLMTARRIPEEKMEPLPASVSFDDLGIEVPE